MTEKITQAIIKAKNAVGKVDGLDEDQKKIAFQTVLRELLRSGEHVIPVKEAEALVESTKGDLGSIEELYNKIKPEGHMNTIIFFAYYFYESGKKTFTSKDIEDSYKKMLLASPANSRDLINKNRQKGLIMAVDHDEKGRATSFQITRPGIEYVKKGFKVK